MQNFVEEIAFHPPKATYKQSGCNTTECNIFVDNVSYVVDLPYTFYCSGTGKLITRIEERPKSLTTIVYCHGNSSDIGDDDIKTFCTKLSTECKVNVVAVEYIGFGSARKAFRNEDDDEKKQSISVLPTEQYTYDSVEAVIDCLTNVWNIPKKKIILMGKSIGSGPAVHFTCQPDEDEYMGLVIDSGFTSCVRIRYELGILQWITDGTIDIFINVKKLSHVNCPVLMFHGSADTVVPVEHASENYDTIPNRIHKKLVIIKDALHNNTIAYDKYFEDIKAFFAL